MNKDKYKDIYKRNTVKNSKEQRGQDKKSLGQSSQAPRVALSPPHWSRLCQLCSRIFRIFHTCIWSCICNCCCITLSSLNWSYLCQICSRIFHIFRICMQLYLYNHVFAIVIVLLCHRRTGHAVASFAPHFWYLILYIYNYLHLYINKIIAAIIILANHCQRWGETGLWHTLDKAHNRGVAEKMC